MYAFFSEFVQKFRPVVQHGDDARTVETGGRDMSGGDRLVYRGDVHKN